ncbi:hypothetical protein LPJ59_006559 [Coemansia sp. RSA 2399]|nr:hypothetical protein LPJ59_006559 [Coemansia sp. RSA 2399]KAJ1887526.1 hypothetical protein LPJ81_006498 [Coemansia sp. IMI 209127]
MTLVTFDIDAETSKRESESETQPAADNSAQTSWQEGRAERIRSLESVLSAVVRRKQHEQQNYRRLKHPHVSEQDYGSMLDSESGDGDSSDDDNGDDNGEDDTLSDSSSFFNSEGQPLLCTYQPPEAPDIAAAPYAATYGSLSSATTCVKTPEQYLPWDVRARDSIRVLCLSVCVCLGSSESSSSSL